MHYVLSRVMLSLLRFLFQFKFGASITFTDFSASVWFHGRGQAGNKLIFSTIKSGTWANDQLALYGGSSGNPKKAELFMKDFAIGYRVPSLDDIPYDRWTHIAGTFDSTTSNF